MKAAEVRLSCAVAQRVVGVYCGPAMHVYTVRPADGFGACSGCGEGEPGSLHLPTRPSPVVVFVIDEDEGDEYTGRGGWR